MNKLATVLIANVLLVVLQPADGADLHVASRGDDTHPGTQAKPFASLERAQDEVRKLKQAGPLTEPVMRSCTRFTASR